MTTPVSASRVAHGAAPAVAFFLALLAAQPASADMLAPIWSGLYVGVHGGAAWSDAETDRFGSLDSTSGQFGGHLGYNIALGGFVVGVEGDANTSSTGFDYTTAGGANGAFETDWSGSVRVRGGVTLGPALLYATVGYAWSEATLTERAADGSKGSGSGSFDGVVYGIGAEAYVMPNLSLRLEALRYDYGSQEISVGGAANSLIEFDPSDTVVRAGVTFHFN